MKNKIKSCIFLYIFLSLNTILGQSASGTWSLLTNQSCSASGQITTSNMAIAAALQGVSYNSTFKTSTSWMRVGTTSGSQLPNGYSATAYVEFTIAPTNGYNLTITSINANLAGGGSSNNKVAAYYSTNGFSSTPGTALGTATYNGSTYAATTSNPIPMINTSSLTATDEGLTTFSPNISITSGQELKIRFYSWNEGATNKYLAIKNVLISGTTAQLCVSPDSKSVTGTASICSGNSTNVTLTGSQTGVSYDLYKNGTIVSSTSKTGDGNDLTWSVNTAGTYTVKTNSTGGYCDGTAMNGSAVVTVNALPTPTFTSAPSSSARFTNVTYTTQASQSSYVWTISGVQDTDYSIVSGGTSTDNSVTLQWLTTGTKTISVNYNNANGCTATSATSTNTEVTSNLAPPTLSAAGGATVDAPFDITFSDDASWRAAITDVTVGGISLAGSAYGFSAGILTLTPANDSKLQTPGSKSVVVIATGYNNATISQTISAGAVSQWAISTQPTAPATNHGTLATQPVITFKDQYNNVTGSGSVTATASNGWILGGTTTVNASSGVATFSGLTASTNDYSALNGVSITFSTSGLSDLASNTFDIPSYSSATTDYYRTKNTGNWNDAATWESSPDNTNWFNATAYPDASANTVTLLHNVSYAGTPTTVGNVTVNSGVTLTNTTTAIAVASGKTLTVASGGFLDNQINNATITAGNGTIQIYGTYKVSAINSNSQIAFTNFTFASGKSGGTLYIGGTNAPRLPFSNAGNVIWAASGSNSILNGTGTTTTIGGDFTINNSSTIINNGSGGSARTLTVTGDLNILSGQYNPMGLPGNSSTSQITTINGNLYLSGSGKLYAAQPKSGAGTGILNIKGNIYVQNPSTSVVLSGGAASKGSLILNGTSQQSFNIEPSVTTSQYIIDSLTISNSNNVILNSNLTLNNLTLTSGNIIPGSYTLTVKGATSGTGKIQNTASSVLEYSGTSAQTISNLHSTDVSGLVVNNTAGVTLADDLRAATVAVNPGAKFTVASGKTLTTNGITLNSNVSGTATLVIDGNLVNTGTAIAEQYLATTRNWYISSPVSNAKAPAGYTYYQRDEAGSSWTSRPFVADSTFVRGRGYIALPGSEAAVITFSTETGGSLNTGDIPVYLTFAGTSSKGYNLIGNPYPSHLTWTKTFVDNNASLIEPSIYYRTTTGTANNQTGWSFKTINASTGEVSPLGTTNTIPPMQAFWIRAKATGTLTLNSDLTKSHNASNPLKAPATKNADRQRLRLQVDNGTATDEAVIYFDAAASDAYDRYDSPKFNEANTVTQIYTTAGTEKLVINGMHSLPLNQEIGLGFVPGSASAFSLRATELTNIPSDVRVILKDNVSKAETDLTDGASVYEFAPATTTDNRFSIIFRTAGVTTGFEKSIVPKAYVYVNANNQITINASEKSNYSIYNAMGQLIENGILTSNTQTSNFKPAVGMYVVKVDNQSIRVIIK